ncbi:hypothetical protein RJ639_046019 [Escallonia herrerae]|uniref:Uncharacterized protein n=1 Tax=Escallonia herrerae TaxID=1293975 RepID=A0AA88WDI8_9ASTE|nr:hypothetical protein RJ639_046019 [Escallonia herrerae]
MEEEMGKQSSLFPLFPQPPDSTSAAASLTIPNTTPRWLSNPSFTADLAAINDAVSSRHATPQIQPEEEEEAEEEEEEVAAGRPQYKLVESSGGDDSDHTNKKRKHKKRKSQSARYAYHYAAPSSRKPDVRSWSDTTTTKDYFFDSRGDRDNLAFGCIYRHISSTFFSFVA